MIEKILESICILGIIGIIGGGMFNYFTGYSCTKTAEIYNTESKYSIWTGCYIKNGDKFVTEQQFKNLQIPNAVYGNAQFDVNIKGE